MNIMYLISMNENISKTINNKDIEFYIKIFQYISSKTY